MHPHTAKRAYTLTSALHVHATRTQYAAFEDEDRVYLVQEYASGVSLIVLLCVILCE